MLKLQSTIIAAYKSIQIRILMLNDQIPIFVTSPQGIWIVKLPGVNVQVTVNSFFITRYSAAIISYLRNTWHTSTHGAYFAAAIWTCK